MHKMVRIPVLALIALTLLITASCASPPSETNNNSTPAASPGTAPAASPSPSLPTPSAPTAESEASAKGSIKIESTPVGAEVLLITEAVGGAGPPEPRGTTPMTITDLDPGTYTVHLEKPGYKFFQKSIQVKPGKISIITATLKK